MGSRHSGTPGVAVIDTREDCLADIFVAATMQTKRPVVNATSRTRRSCSVGTTPLSAPRAAIDGDYLYAFAADKKGLGVECSLGRVPTVDALDRSAWTFWTGDGWSANTVDMQALFGCGQGLTVFRHGSVWLAVYTANLSNDVYARSASLLTGPWSAETKLFTADRKGDDGWTYDAYVHPELTPPDGKALFVSFTRPNKQGWFGSPTALVRVDLQ